jgi:hypothetical protein
MIGGFCQRLKIVYIDDGRRSGALSGCEIESFRHPVIGFARPEDLQGAFNGFSPWLVFSPFDLCLAQVVPGFAQLQAALQALEDLDGLSKSPRACHWPWRCDGQHASARFVMV